MVQRESGQNARSLQLLATEGRTYADRTHTWHLALADRLSDAVPDLVTRTRRVEVDTHDPQSVDAGAQWWHELTDKRGEGMVVMPTDNLTRGAKGLVQPGLKVRGREYLRLIYGPDYTVPAIMSGVTDERVSGTWLMYVGGCCYCRGHRFRARALA